MILFSNKDRPFDLGPYPLERLPRDDSVVAADGLQGLDRFPPNVAIPVVAYGLGLILHGDVVWIEG